MRIKLNVSNLKIRETDAQITKRVKDSIVENFDKNNLRGRINDLHQEVANFFYLQFLKSDTFVSLLNGKLRAEFGFTDSYANNLEDICREISSSYIDFKISNRENFLKIFIGVHNKDDIDFNDIGVYTTEKGEQIYWLYWLLTQGTKTVVPEYKVLFREGLGRSHMAIMVTKEGENYSYSVDPNFAGTEDNNWVTRILKQNKDEFLDIIKKHFNGLKKSM